MRALLSAIQDLFAVDADLFLDEVRTWLAFEHNIIISLFTFSHTLKQAGLTHKILQKLAAERDDIRQEEFQASIRNDFIGDGSKFVSSTKLARMGEPTHDIMVGRQVDSEHN